MAETLSAIRADPRAYHAIGALYSLAMTVALSEHGTLGAVCETICIDMTPIFVPEGGE